MGKRPRAPLPSPDTSYVLSLFSTAPGTSSVIRTLSDTLEGLGTHFVAGRPVWCRQDECPVAVHKHRYQWRGYFAGEVWIPKVARWAPYVVEVSEACELDLRGIFRRGQQWELSRLPVSESNKPPVVGLLLSEDDPASYPPVFDIIPTLSRIYHANVVLGVENWMPARTVVKMSDGAPPPGFAAAPPRPERKELGPVKSMKELDEEWKRKRHGTMADLNGTT
jgi:hypothetical protein